MRKSFSLFCWNIHSCVGRDGKCDPDRVRRALASVDFDVYCLQEGRVALEGEAKSLTREKIAAAYFGV